MDTHPPTKALKADQLKGELKGDLASYEKFGLFQRSVNQKTAYRYRGALLRYQLFLGENPPSLGATYQYLGTLRKNAFDPSTLRVYRAALAGYHEWRGEELKFKVKVPETSAKYVPWEIVQKMLELAAAKPHDELILRLMANAGLRRDEVVNLKISNVEDRKLRFRGKGGKERVVPMTAKLQTLIVKFSAGRLKEESLVQLGEKGVYLLVKRYGSLAGMPEIAPHDLRRAFGTHLYNITGNIRVVQDLLGHSDVNTTQVYTAVTLNNLEDAIKRLETTRVDEKKIADTQTLAGKESVISQKNEAETLHSRQMRELAKTIAAGIQLPSTLDKTLWRNLPVEFDPGKYYLPIGIIDISVGHQVSVQYPDIGAGMAETYLINGLFDHLSSAGSSKFSELVGDKGKFRNFVVKAGQYSEALLSFLKLMADEVKGYNAKVYFHYDEKPGLTKWFIVSAWNAAIQKAGGHSWIDSSWYHECEKIPGNDLWQVRVGGAAIGIAKSTRTLQRYENWHKKLILNYSSDPRVRDIAVKDQELGIIVQDIKQRLLEFSDMQPLPGHCELC